ncbi:LETM1 and EF-hand domain-containing protein anon-60Da isoform 1 [Hibiscus syriacus]|uniref:LETM1 and EF-hand domain-containing protein anon-60Da isoform 1 n=1 Tax=Hibiscus syriacus TaxID=106335 RepID=A0A6A3DA79_HIBSY|nr:LETM1 and EF-hand domain-containing protein anon-60Da isoform 1 [Hibiscus syriacus]
MESSSNHSEPKTREEKLLETIVTSGVRLQPTSDAIQAFLVEAAKLDALALSHALESKLLSPVWQVCMKAILPKLLSERRPTREQADLAGSNSERSLKPVITPVRRPDLIDTGDLDDYDGQDASSKDPNNQNTANMTRTQLIDDLFGDGIDAGLGATEQNDDDDPFAGVSFHTNESRENVEDLFSGMTIDGESVVSGNHVAANEKSELIDIFGTTSEAPFKAEIKKDSVNDLIACLSMTENLSNSEQKGITSEAPENRFANINTHSSHQASNDALSGILGSQATRMSKNPMFPSESCHMPFLLE